MPDLVDIEVETKSLDQKPKTTSGPELVLVSFYLLIMTDYFLLWQQ